jgi:hypothetical protein
MALLGGRPTTDPATYLDTHADTLPPCGDGCYCLTCESDR